MARVSIEIARPLEDVWTVITDAERYPRWLLGAQEVDAPVEWPAPGTSFRHRIGVGPLTLPGSTTSRELVTPTAFHLRAGMGPLGEADVLFELDKVGPEQTVVTMTERPVGGLIAFANKLIGSVVDRLIKARNTESLRQLNTLLAQ